MEIFGTIQAFQVQKLARSQILQNGGKCKLFTLFTIFIKVINLCSQISVFFSV